ncbi:MAG: PEP-CTERM sorting domain-containing protein [Planctomycetota bacterium]|jgi:hypothetical protein
MKKLLVLMLVFGMTSIASATITSLMNVQDDGGGMFSIQIPNLNNVDDGLGGYWALIGNSSYPVIGGAIAATIPSYFVTLSSVLGDAGDTGLFAYGIGRWGAFGTTTPTYSTSPAVYADSFSIGPYTGGEFNLYLYAIADDLSSVTLINTYYIPEPMTIALLGLGGLFLLRRRK